MGTQDKPMQAAGKAQYRIAQSIEEIRALSGGASRILYRDSTGWEVMLAKQPNGALLPEGSRLPEGPAWKDRAEADGTSIVFDCSGIKPGAKISNSIIGRDTRIGWYATIRNSQVGRAAVIGYNTTLNDAVVWARVIIGDNATIGADKASAWKRGRNPKAGSNPSVVLASGCMVLDRAFIERGCRIGRSIIRVGVTIGHNSNIGDGYEIDVDQPPFTLLPDRPRQDIRRGVTEKRRGPTYGESNRNV